MGYSGVYAVNTGSSWTVGLDMSNVANGGGSATQDVGIYQSGIHATRLDSYGWATGISMFNDAHCNGNSASAQGTATATQSLWLDGVSVSAYGWNGADGIYATNDGDSRYYSAAAVASQSISLYDFSVSATSYNSGATGIALWQDGTSVSTSGSTTATQDLWMMDGSVSADDPDGGATGIRMTNNAYNNYASTATSSTQSLWADGVSVSASSYWSSAAGVTAANRASINFKSATEAQADQTVTFIVVYDGNSNDRGAAAARLARRGRRLAGRGPLGETAPMTPPELMETTKLSVFEAPLTISHRAARAQEVFREVAHVKEEPEKPAAPRPAAPPRPAATPMITDDMLAALSRHGGETTINERGNDGEKTQRLPAFDPRLYNPDGSRKATPGQPAGAERTQRIDPDAARTQRIDPDAARDLDFSTTQKLDPGTTQKLEQSIERLQEARRIHLEGTSSGCKGLDLWGKH